MLYSLIPSIWRKELRDYLHSDDFKRLDELVSREYDNHTVYPSKENIFNAINGLAPSDIKVVLLGQDPYHEPNQAHGLCFSTLDSVLPASLQNIFKEMKDDIGVVRTDGNLSDWKRQGILMLNTVLTVREHEANSHKDFGWQKLTSEILRSVISKEGYKVFVLWGSQALSTFRSVYNNEPNVDYICSAHPSPLSAYRGFFGSKPFSKVNDMLLSHNAGKIIWAD